MNDNKTKTSQKMMPINGRIVVMIKLDLKTHQALILESLKSRSNGKKKNLPEIIEDRIIRDLSNHPVYADN